MLEKRINIKKSLILSNDEEAKTDFYTLLNGVLNENKKEVKKIDDLKKKTDETCRMVV